MKNKKQVAAEVEEQAPAYKATGKHISWKFKRGVVKMEIDDLDRVFYEYSKRGLNMSQIQVQNKHGLTAIEWQSLKRTFDLVKDSDPFSPHTLSFYSGKEKCDKIAAKEAEKYSPKNMREVIAYEDNKQRQRAYNKAIKDASNLDYQRQKLETAILEYITEAKVVPTIRKSADVKVKNSIGLVADIHYGADIKAERNLPEFNEKVIIKKLAMAAKDMNERRAKNMKVIINGDLIETFTGLNHINSWQNIDKKNGYGVDATIRVAEILTDFISSVNNVKEVTILSGNHDRTTSSNKEDVSGGVAKLVAFILNARFKKGFSVKWVKDVYSFKMDGCGIVISHGHFNLSKKNPESLINHYGFPGCFNLGVFSHLHTRKVLADGLNFRIIHSPSIFTGNDYSKGLGFSSLAGYLYITVKGGHPIITDVPLP